MGDGYINTQNPKNEPPIIKTLDLRVKNSFPQRVGNRDFRRKSRENTKNFVSSDFKIAAKNYRGLKGLIGGRALGGPKDYRQQVKPNVQ